MQAVVLKEYGEANVLQVQDIPKPEPSSSEVRVKIAICGLNHADLLQRRGQYPPPVASEYEIPGLEFAGTIEKIGSKVSNWQNGERVFGLLSGGGYAEQVVTSERMLMPIPDNLSFAQAAAIPEVFFTAYDALIDKGKFQAGDVVLIHAGGSGVGTAATQLARVMGASQIFTTSRSESKLARSKALGATAINSTTEDYVEVIKSATDGYGADLVLDFIGANYLAKNLEVAAVAGTIVQIATLGGANSAIDLSQMMKKRLTLVGTTLRNRSIEQKMSLTQTFAQKILPLFALDKLEPIIDRSFTLEQVVQAHQYMESSSNFGKILLEITK